MYFNVYNISKFYIHFYIKITKQKLRQFTALSPTRSVLPDFLRMDSNSVIYINKVELSSLKFRSQIL